MRVSYNGYYVTFPRSRRGFDSLYPHHFGTKLETVARQGDRFQFCSEMVAMYAKARTYFERKS